GPPFAAISLTSKWRRLQKFQAGVPKWPASGSSSDSGRRLDNVFGVLRLFVADQNRLSSSGHGVFVYHNLFHVTQAGQLVHRVQQRQLNDGTQAACPCPPFDGALRNSADGIRQDFELHVFHGKQFLELLDERVSGLRKNSDQCIFVKFLQSRHDRQATHKFGDETKFDQILRLRFAEEFAHALFALGTDRGGKADAGAFAAVTDNFFQAVECTTHNEQNIGGVDLNEILVGMLATTLRRHRSDRTFNQFEQRLLHAFAGNISRDGWVVGLAGDLIDFVDINNGPLRLLDVVIAVLQQFLNDVFVVLTHVTGFGQCGGVCHDERHVQHARQGLCKQRLARTSGPDQQDVALAQLDAIVFDIAIANTLVMVIDCDGQSALGLVLTNDVAIKEFLNLGWRRQLIADGIARGFLGFLQNDVIAKVDAFIADEHRRPGDKL